MQEEWKPVKGYEKGYLISNYGYVKTIGREYVDKKGRSRKVDEKILKKVFDKTIKVCKVNLVNIDNINEKKSFAIHKLVYTHFISELNESRKYFIRHIDGDPFNCASDNLVLKNNAFDKKEKEIKIKVKKEKIKKPKKEKPKIEKVRSKVNIIEQTFTKKYIDGKYIDNNKLIYEVILSKGMGKRTRKLEEMLYNITHGVFIKFVGKYPLEYRYDILHDTYLHMLNKYNKFDNKVYDNAIAYYTELVKRGLADAFNKEIYKTKNYTTFGKNKFISMSKLINI